MGINRRRFIHNSGMAAAGLGAGMAATPTLGEAAAQNSGTPTITVTGYKTILLDNIDPPTKPGLGIELDDRVVQRQLAS